MELFAGRVRGGYSNWLIGQRVQSIWTLWNKYRKRRDREIITRKTASRAANTVMSAQETILPHSLWIRPRRSSIVFNASGLTPTFAGWSLSPGLPSNSNDPSHPYTDQSTTQHQKLEITQHNTLWIWIRCRHLFLSFSTYIIFWFSGTR